MRKLVMTSLIMVVMFAVACKGNLANSDTGLESRDFIYANNVTVTLEQDLISTENKVAPIPHFSTRTLALDALPDVIANIKADKNYRVSLTAEELKKRLKLGGSMAPNVTIDVVGVRNNNKKATFTVIVNEKSGYKFDNGVIDRFNIISKTTKNSKWIEEIDMSNHTFAIIANRHIAGNAHNLSFPATETIIFKDGAIVTTTIQLLDVTTTTPKSKTIPKNVIRTVTKIAFEEALRLQSLNDKIIVTTVAGKLTAGTDTAEAKLEVEITIKAKDDYFLTGLKESEGTSTGILTIKVPSGFEITE